MRTLIGPILALLFGAALLVAGQGLLSTLIAVRLDLGGAGRGTIALAMGSYFTGLVVGSLLVSRLITGVGHIRTFAALAAVVAAVASVHALAPSVALWCVLRLLNGVCYAGLLVVVESWLSLTAEAENRGTVLSCYMIVFYLALGTGQFLLGAADPAGTVPFLLAAVLLSLALVPVALTRVAAPVVPELSRLGLRGLVKSAPMGVVGAIGAGVVLGAFYGMGPVYAGRIGLDVGGVARFMGVGVMAGLLLQWPLGRLSDQVDRRLVLGGAALAAAVASAALFLWVDAPSEARLALAAGFGAFVAPLYPLSLAHTNDRVEPGDRLGAGSTLVLVSSAGSAVGPFAAAGAMALLGPRGLFVLTGAVALLLGAYTLRRQIARAPIPPGDRDPFVAVPRTTSAVGGLDPRVEPAGEG